MAFYSQTMLEMALDLCANGAGIGASHQPGWTGTVAKLIQLFGHLDSRRVLEGGSRPVTSVYLSDEKKGWP